jgi:hypothetical protein
VCVGNVFEQCRFAFRFKRAQVAPEERHLDFRG